MSESQPDSKQQKDVQQGDIEALPSATVEDNSGAAAEPGQPAVEMEKTEEAPVKKPKRKGSIWKKLVLVLFIVGAGIGGLLFLIEQKVAEQSMSSQALQPVTSLPAGAAQVDVQPSGQEEFPVGDFASLLPEADPLPVQEADPLPVQLVTANETQEVQSIPDNPPLPSEPVSKASVDISSRPDAVEAEVNATTVSLEDNSVRAEYTNLLTRQEFEQYMESQQAVLGKVESMFAALSQRIERLETEPRAQNSADINALVTVKQDVIVAKALADKALDKTIALATELGGKLSALSTQIENAQSTMGSGSQSNVPPFTLFSIEKWDWNQEYAIFTPDNGEAPFTVGEGESHGDWRIVDISYENSLVKLLNKVNRAEVELRI